MKARVAHRLRSGPTEADVQAARERLAAVARVQGRSVNDILIAAGWDGAAKPHYAIIADALDATEGVGIMESTTAETESAKTPTLRERRLDLGVMMTTQPPQIDMVLRGLPLGSIGVILGSGGVGKSMLVLHIAAAVATGHDDLGCLLADGDRRTGRVVYLTGEDDDLIVHYRIRAFAEHVGEDRRQALLNAMRESVDIVSLVGSAPTLVDCKGLANETALAQVREAAKGTRLLVIDPLRQYHSADENDNGAMTTISKALAKIAHEERCAVILVHHVSKNGSKDEDADAAMSRGASAITDNARWVMGLKKLSDAQHETAGLDGEAWQYLQSRLVKANYTALGGGTILHRCYGGVLAQVLIRPVDVEVVVKHIVGTSASPQRPDTVVYDDGSGDLDPATGEPFPAAPDRKLTAREMLARRAS